uniref:Uncharacterized protein n=1 Tax=Anopheles merus TaxID=30066 RepID=A0A182VG87_ANOME
MIKLRQERNMNKYERIYTSNGNYDMHFDLESTLTFQSNDSTSGTPPSRRFTSSINRRAISGRRRFTISTTRSCRFGESWARLFANERFKQLQRVFQLVAGGGMTEQLGQTVATLLALPGHLDNTFCGGRFVDTVLAIFDRAVLGSAVFSFAIFGRTIAGSMVSRTVLLLVVVATMMMAQRTWHIRHCVDVMSRMFSQPEGAI